MKMLNVPPSSRASPLPQVLLVYAKAAYTQILGGSGLARESGVSVMKMLNVPPSSRASPLPQVLLVYAKAAYTPNPLWERACPRKRSVCHEDVECTDVFAGKPAPTGLGGVCEGCVHPQSPVGAGKLGFSEIFGRVSFAHSLLSTRRPHRFCDL